MLTTESVRAAANPLRLIFWGSLIWFLDLSFTTTQGSTGLRIDLLDDTLGTVMIMIGVTRLAAIPVSPTYRQAMTALRIIMLFSIAETVVAHFVFAEPDWYRWLVLLLQTAEGVGVGCFCFAMRRFCDAAGLPLLAWHWKICGRVILALYLLPLLLIDLLAIGAGEPHRTYNLDRDPAAALLLFILAVGIFALIYSLVCISRTRVAVLRAVPVVAPRGFPVIPNARVAQPENVDTLTRSDFF